MQYNLLHLQSCALGDATSVVALTIQAYAWSKTMQLTKLNTWVVRIIKDSIKEDHQDSIREEISLRAKIGGPSDQPPNQEPNLYEKTTKLEEILA